MDNLFEIIVPLIFAAIYFFGNMLSKKSDDDAAPTGRPADEDADAIERQRRIQEEIRRKIMERRREAQGEGGRPRPPLTSESARPAQSTSESPHPSRHPAERRREMHEKQKENRDRRQSAHPKSSQTRQSSQGDGGQIPDTPYGNEMQAQLKQIEATKRQAEKLKKQAAQRTSSLRPQSSTLQEPDMRGRSRAARRPVRSTLRDPAAARAAFIYGEVLGPPISQRKAQTVPGLVN